MNQRTEAGGLEKRCRGKDENEIMSQTTRTMLLGALIATAGLWIFIMTVAMGYVAFRI
jgi:hypothetical protein